MAGPPLQGFNFNLDGNSLSSASFNGNNLETNLTSTPQQSLLRNSFSDLFGNIFGQLQQTPEGRQAQIEEFGQATFDEITAPLRDERQRALLQTRENFNRRGLQDSTSFEDFKRDNIEQVFQRGLLDAGRQSIFAREDLSAQREARLLNLLNTASSGLQQDFNNTLNLGQITQSGAVNANNIVNQNFLAGLQAQQLQLQKNALKSGGGSKGGLNIGGILSGAAKIGSLFF